jgi:hypothetical protein
MSASVNHCPFLNRTDARCSKHFCLDHLQHAFKFCFDRYKACPVYLELLVERRVRRLSAWEKEHDAASRKDGSRENGSRDSGSRENISREAISRETGPLVQINISRHRPSAAARVEAATARAGLRSALAETGPGYAEDVDDRAAARERGVEGDRFESDLRPAERRLDSCGGVGIGDGRATAARQGRQYAA